jgi:phage protein D
MSVGNAGAVNVEILLDGKHVPDEHHVSFVIDRDINQPDMAAIVLTNQNHMYSALKLAAPVEVQIGGDKVSIYKGEIVGIEPIYKGGEKTKIVIRAMNKMHRLLRKRKSLTFTDKSDQQILSAVANDAGLSLEWKHDKSITYKHVYQHNQTDLEFLRTRAARMGCHIWCVDTKLYCKQPDLSNDSGIMLKVQEDVAEGQSLRAFTPRMSSAPVLKKVTVKGWNPETKELITGTAEAASSPLGSQNPSAGSNAHGEDETFTVDHPIWSKEEADALAKAKMTDASLNHITGEAEAVGDPKFELGKTVKITVNPSEPSDVFNGKYYVMGITHRHTHSAKEKGAGYVTTLRLARNAQKGS